MHRSQSILFALLMPWIASCGTTPSASSVPTPGLDALEQEVKCPAPPVQYTRIIPAPLWQEGEGYYDLALKYRDWGLDEWKEMTGRAQWEKDHPGC